MNDSKINHSIEAKIERHRAFLERSRTDRPLVGCIQGWENISRYVQDTEAFWPEGKVKLKDFSSGRFLPMYRSYAATLDETDDLFRTLEPFPFFPWTEAAIGCPVMYTGKNFWSSPVEELKTDHGFERWIEKVHAKFMSRGSGQVGLNKGETIPGSGKQDLNNPEPASDYVQKDLNKLGTDPGSGHIDVNEPVFTEHSGLPHIFSQWSAVYGDLLDALGKEFGERYPTGQSILRGPLDMASAVFGEERMIYLFFDRPQLMKAFLEIARKIFLHFTGIHQDRARLFHNGYVIGSYYLWTPGPCLRLQEDAMALLSPDIYREFVHPIDSGIASKAEFTLFHLHSTGMHLLDILLENRDLRILQVSKDEGVELKAILPQLKKIQEAGRCLVLKGRLNREEADLLKKNLDFRGLCVQAVVRDQTESNDFCMAFS